MKRIAVLLFIAVLACVSGAYALFSSQHSASADPAPITVDSVNIGKIDSPAQGPVCSMPYSTEETAHSASGWGWRVEPACTGGGWAGGGSDGTARAAWHRYEYDALGNLVDGTNSPEGTVTLSSGGYQLGTLVVEALDGQAASYESNSFEVRVNGTLVYTYHATPGGAETWVVHNIDLVNPANSTRTPSIGSFDPGDGIDPCTTSLTVEVKNLGQAWAMWSTYGQLGVSNLKLKSTDPATMCEADVGIVSQDFVDPPTEIDVSADVPVTLRKHLHNIGPYGPVQVSITPSASAPADCTATPAQGNPTSATLPVSVDTVVDEGWTIHCSKASAHTFTFNDAIAVTSPDVTDPDMGNNVASTDLTVDAVAKADVKIVSQQFVNPPSQIDLSTNVPVTMRKVLHNNGPYTADPVTVTINNPAVIIDDCTINPPPAKQVVLPHSVDVTVDETFIIHCSKASSHSLSVTNRVSGPKEPHISDPDMTNNRASTTLTVNVIAYADAKIVSQSVVGLPPNIPVSEDVPVTIEKVLHNNGSYGPVTVEVGAILDSVNIGKLEGQAGLPCPAPPYPPYPTVALSAEEATHAATGWGPTVEPECTNGNYGGGSDDGTSRLAWHPGEPLGGDDPAERTASVTLNSGGFKPAILRINALDGMAGVPIPDDSFEVRVNGTLVYTYLGSNPVTAETWVVHNIDLFSPGASTRQPVIPNSNAIPGAAIAPANTLVVEIKSIGQKWQWFNTYGQMAVSWVELLAGNPTQVELPVSVDVPVTESLAIHCWEPSSHTFTITNKILGIEDEHIVDPDLGNNSATSQITVDCIAHADAKIVSQSFVSPPTTVNVSEDVPVTLEKILHNNGPDGPVTVEVGAILDRVDIGKNEGQPPCNAPLSAAEAAHAAAGWGPTIEPACTGGGYGGGSDDGTSRLVWHPGEPGGPVPTASVTLSAGGFKPGTLRINALDGIANDDPPPTDDSFEVYVNNTLVYTYHSARFQGEKWVVHNIDLVNPAASSQQPVLSGSSWVAGAPIAPSGTLVVEIRAIGGPWHAFNTYGQLAVSWVELLAGSPTQVELPVSVDVPVTENLAIHCWEPSSHTFTVTNKILKIEGEHIVDPDLGNNSATTDLAVDCIAYTDVKIVSQGFVSPPAQIDVSANVPVKLRKVLHNNGPYPDPVHVTVTETATAPADCTISQNAPEQVELPQSVDVTVDEDFTIHCSKPSSHTFTVDNVVSGPKEPHIVDPDLGNNGASTNLTVAAMAKANVQIVSQAFVSPPSQIGVSANVAVTLRKHLHNIGPFGPVQVSITPSAVAPQDCTATPAQGNPTSVNLPVSADVVVDEGWTIHCSKASLHTFTFNDTIAVTTPHVTDPVTGNNSAQTQLTVDAIGTSDVKVVSISVPDISAKVNESKTVTLSAVIHNNGPYGPALTHMRLTFLVEPGCTLQVQFLGHSPQPVTSGEAIDSPNSYALPAFVPLPALSVNVIGLCDAPKDYMFSGSAEIVVDDPHVHDPDTGNNSLRTEHQVPVIAYADMKVVGQYVENPPAQIPVSEDVVVTLDKVIHNNGPWGPVDAETETNITVPSGCTASPNPHIQQFYNLPVSVDILHHEPFVIHCSSLGPHTFTFDDEVGLKDPHVIDLDLTNNTEQTTLTVDGVAKADVKITGASFVNPPTKIPLGQDVNVTLKKHIHNNGPWGPVNIAINSTAAPPTGCTIVPKTVPTSISGVPVSVDQVVDEVWTINCIQDTTVKTFVFDASIDVSTAFVFDPNLANNAVHKLLSVTDDPADPQGDMDDDSWSNGAEAIIGTDPVDACPDDANDDAWPPDLNNNASVNILDVLLYKPVLGAPYNPRFDLNADQKVSILDVLLYKPVLGASCTNP